MSSTQDLCDGVATLTDAARRFEEAQAESGAAAAAAWVQMRRAIGYMQTMAAWKEEMSIPEMLSAGTVADALDERWDYGAQIEP